MLLKIYIILFLILQLSLQAREINLNSKIKESNLANKHVLVWLHRTDCGYCESMKEFTFTDEKVAIYMDKYFSFVHININEKDTIIYKNFKGSGREFARDIGYDFYPTALFFSKDSELIFVEIGYLDSEKESNENRFLRILHFIESKEYSFKEFSAYKFQNKEEVNE